MELLLERPTRRTELNTRACVYSRQLAHHCQIVTTWGSGTTNAGRHLLLQVIDLFLVQQPYTLSVLNLPGLFECLVPLKFWSRDRDNETVRDVPVNVFQLTTQHPWRPRVVGGVLPQTPRLHCDSRPSTSVVCDAQRRRQWLASPFLDVAFPWFTRSSSATSAIYCVLCAHITRKRVDQFWSFKHCRLKAFGRTRPKLYKTKWGCSDGKCSHFLIFFEIAAFWALVDGEMFLTFFEVCLWSLRAHIPQHMLLKIWKLCRSEDPRPRLAGKDTWHCLAYDWYWSCKAFVTE